MVLAVCAAAAFFTGCSSRTAMTPLATATGVDIQRYAGHWYEVFRLPNSFQRDDAKAEANYTLQRDGTVRVVNTETRPDGTQKTAEGTATVVPDGRNSRFRVKFEGLAALIPVSEEGNYWIVKLEPDYSAALVGTPDRKFLWLLSRTPKINAERRNSYEAEARRLGFDTRQLIHSR